MARSTAEPIVHWLSLPTDPRIPVCGARVVAAASLLVTFVREVGTPHLEPGGEGEWISDGLGSTVSSFFWEIAYLTRMSPFKPKVVRTKDITLDLLKIVGRVGSSVRIVGPPKSGR